MKANILFRKKADKDVVINWSALAQAELKKNYTILETEILKNEVRNILVFKN